MKVSNVAYDLYAVFIAYTMLFLKMRGEKAYIRWGLELDRVHFAATSNARRKVSLHGVLHHLMPSVIWDH